MRKGFGATRKLMTLQQAAHLTIGGQHFRKKAIEADAPRRFDQLPQQRRADAVPLPSIRHRHTDFCASTVRRAIGACDAQELVGLGQAGHE
ncbi:MAG TPA: hypothetical protein VHM25_05815, partial [Polyangiaceae bacterium]|nr:hypothetical protein [Polyangiaceae bacterium]